MGTYPASARSAFLLWCQEHGPVFAAHAAEIGLTPAQAAAFNAGTAAAAAARLAQEAARQASLVATRAAEAGLDDLRALAGDTVRAIRAFAGNSPEPGAVYNLAQIPSPAARHPAPPPARPTGLSVTLDSATGTLNLRWKADNPRGTSGTSYIIKRRLPGEAQFTFVGVTGAKTFADESFTAGPESVQYTVQGQRADRSGPVSEIFTVNFGRAPASDVELGAKAPGVDRNRARLAA